MVKPPHTGVHKWNADYVKREMADPHWIDFFQQVEKSELTEEQQEAVVIHEDRNRLVAAAGSGKSSTLVAKVGYAIQKGYVDSQEVLALAFNDKAAEEIRIRLADRLGISIRAQTFHSLGNSIIRDVTGQKTRPEVGSRQLMQKWSPNSGLATVRFCRAGSCSRQSIGNRSRRWSSTMSNPMKPSFEAREGTKVSRKNGAFRRFRETL